MARHIGTRLAPLAIGVGPAGLVALFIGVPLALAAIWLLRDAPPVPDCYEQIAGLDAMRDHWLRGARLAFGAGALIVLSAIMQTSALRRADHRPGPETTVLCVLVALYVLACVAYQPLFAVYAVLLVLAGVGWWASAPLVTIPTVVWFLRRPREHRPLAALAVLGWLSLLLGVGTVCFAVAARASDPLFAC